MPSLVNNSMNTYVADNREDRQWDCRLNIPNPEYLDKILENLKSEVDKGKFVYLLVGGLEIGTRPTQDDYLREHVHIAAIFHNRASKSSILRNWGIIAGHGFYLVPRNRELPYDGWKNHHTKVFSKVDQTKLVIYEHGSLPVGRSTPSIKSSDEEKKRKVDDILIEMRTMLGEGKTEECFTKFPRNYLIYGERLKALISQKQDFFKEKEFRDPHIWLYGFPGTGKTALLNYIYPKTYKKNLYNKFFDLYDDKIHDHIILEDLDHEAVERLSINFIKTICDQAGFAIDQKYKSCQLSQTTVLVSSNFTIPDIICDGKGIEENKAALLRRFYHVRIDAMLKFLGLKLIGKYARDQLNKEGNNDFGKLFFTWDYMRDCPQGIPIQSPEYYAKKIRDAYFD